MDDPHAQSVHEDPTDLDLQILDVLREDAKSAELLAETLSQWGEQVGVDAVRVCLEGLASHGLARPNGEAPHDTDESDADERVAGAEDDQQWEITEEGRAVVEPHSGVASAPYHRGVSEEEDEDRDVAALVVLLLIALVTGVCAAYTLLTATGVLGGG
jgi:hypothetical protein